MADKQDLIPVEDAAARLGMSRVTFWRRVTRNWNLTVYADPRDLRRRLVNWPDVERAFRAVQPVAKKAAA